jgi:hypothetical protein
MSTRDGPLRGLSFLQEKQSEESAMSLHLLRSPEKCPMGDLQEGQRSTSGSHDESIWPIYEQHSDGANGPAEPRQQIEASKAKVQRVGEEGDASAFAQLAREKLESLSKANSRLLKRLAATLNALAIAAPGPPQACSSPSQCADSKATETPSSMVTLR